MPRTETELKQQLKEGLSPLYVLYGDEPYLTAHYAGRITELAAGDPSLQEFNLQKFDGQNASWDVIETAAEALPVMAAYKCVVVRDFDVGANPLHDRLMAFVQDPPSSCVLIFWQETVQPDRKKSAKWKAFETAVDQHGMCVSFPRKTAGDTAKLLCSGAAKRGCKLSPDNAKRLIERCGNDLNLLLNELDKLCALADGQEITRQHIETASAPNLEARIFDLSKAILQGQYGRAYALLNTLFFQKEKAVVILATLSSAYADLYRAKIAAAAGVSADTLCSAFQYRGKEFRVRNALRDCAHMSVRGLRQSLEVLAEADTRLKSSRSDDRLILEQTAARLIILAKTERE